MWRVAVAGDPAGTFAAWKGFGLTVKVVCTVPHTRGHDGAAVEPVRPHHADHRLRREGGGRREGRGGGEAAPREEGKREGGVSGMTNI